MSAVPAIVVKDETRPIRIGNKVISVKEDAKSVEIN